MEPHLYARLIVILTAAFLCDICVSDIPERGSGSQNGGIISVDTSWHNKTCKNIFCCIDSVLQSMNADRACLRVEGYGCHLRYQMQKFADTECELKNNGVLECHRNILDCASERGTVLIDTQDKDCSDVEDIVKPLLHCERGRTGTGSLTCQFTNSTYELSQCPDVTECQYKKERVSCPSGWAPHRGNCYIYQETPGLPWDWAEGRCSEFGGGAHLTNILREEENNYTSFNLLKTLSNRENNIWWTGLRRIQPNQENLEGHVFQWSDNKTFDPVTDYKNWGIKSPETDVNHCVYVRNGKWYLANCDEQYGYSCKMPVYGYEQNNFAKAAVDEDLPEDSQDPLHPYKSLYCRATTMTMTSPRYITEDTNEKGHTVTTVKTTPRYTSTLAQTMTSQKKVTTVANEMSTTFTMKVETSPVEHKVIQMKASAQEVGDEINSITRELGLREEDQAKITNEIGVLTSNVGDESVEAVTSVVEAIDELMDLFVESITQDMLTQRETSDPIVIESESMVVQVYAIRKAAECVNKTNSCASPPIVAGVKDQTYSVSIPGSIADSGATLAMSTLAGLQDIMSTNSIDGNDDDKATTIASLITSISLSSWKDGVDVNDILKTDPLVLTFSVVSPSKESADQVPVCSYWDPNELAWSSVGTTYNAEKSNKTHMTCDVTHLTSFAILMQVMPTSVEKKPMPRTLDYLTYIGCGLSIFCLSLLIFIFFIQKMHRSDRNIIHMNLAFALLIAQVIFVLGIDQTSIQGVCKGVAAFLHYFLLATFCWMLNEAIFLLSKTTSARIRWLKMPLFLGIGWGTPVIVVGITLAAGFDIAYHTRNYCWLQAPKAIWAFVGPAALIILINTCMLIKVIHVFLSLKANMNKKKKERIWLSLRAMLLTLPLLGTTWLIGIFSMDNKVTLVFAYLFVILNSLQGVFIFVLYCVMNDEVKKGIEKRMSIFSTHSSNASTPGKTSKGSRSTP